MRVNLNSIIRDFKNANIVTVLKEAVVNSIQAHAKEIQIVFEFEKGLELNENAPKDETVLSIDVFDDGEGFTEKNIESFSTYKSDYKIKEGCKGIGRISYLKVFKKINITSFVKNEDNTDTCISLNFTPRFTQNSFKKKADKQTAWWKTHVHFETPNEQKKFNIKSISNEIYYHLLPLLLLKKEKNIEIKFYEKIHDGSCIVDDNSTIKTQEVPYLNQENFEVGHSKIPFTLSYYFKQIENSKNSNGIIEAFYCANKRTVMSFSKFIEINPINNMLTIFLLESPIFDKCVNDERDEFSIDKETPDLLTQLSWDDINKNLTNVLIKIIDTQFPDLKKQKDTFLKEIVEEYPYLVDFLGAKEVIGGVFQKDKFIENAEKKYSKEKLLLRKKLRDSKGKLEENLQKARKFASLELTQYIEFRDYILQRFDELMKPATLEKEVHNLFVPQRRLASKTSPLPLKENNLWLLDDKFMSYDYLQSEEEIKKFLSEVNLSAENPEKDAQKLSDRPDVVVYFDSIQEKKRAVLIEFKRPKANYKTDGIVQLDHYAQILIQNGVSEVYMYLIAEIDNAFENALRLTYKFSPIFSSKGKIYQRSLLPDLNAHQQVISSEAIIGNAKARNHVFMKIIKEDSLRHLST
ncbi:ATP-binding protein [Bartonella sp. B30(2025)]